MDEAVEVLILVGMILFMGAIFGFVVYSWRHTNKRDGRSDEQRADLIRFVQGRGWSHTAHVPGGGDRYCGGPPLPVDGVNVPVWDLVTGEFRGRAFCCFEYHTRDINANGPETWQYYSVFAVTMPTSSPRMTVDRPRALDKVNTRLQTAVFGGGEVVELGIPEFDEQFRVIADDTNHARIVLSGHLGQFLTSDPRAKDHPLRFHGNELLTWHKGRIRPEQIEPKLDYLCDIVDSRPVQT